MSFQFSTTQSTTTTKPPDRRAEINIGNTIHPPVGGTSTWATPTVAPDPDPSKYFNITLAHQIIFNIVTAPERSNYPYLNKERIVIADETVTYNSTSQVTTFLVRFLDPMTTTTGSGDDPFGWTTETTTTTADSPFGTTTSTTKKPGTTTTTVPPRPRNDVPSSLEIAWWFRNHVFKTTFAAMNPPYSLVPPAYFLDVPPDTPAPVTQEIYTPVPTVDEANANITSFFTENQGNAEIIAIVVSVVIGSIFVVTAVIGFKSWYDSKQLRNRPSGMKYHRGHRDV